MSMMRQEIEEKMKEESRKAATDSDEVQKYSTSAQPEEDTNLFASTRLISSVDPKLPFAHVDVKTVI